MNIDKGTVRVSHVKMFWMLGVFLWWAAPALQAAVEIGRTLMVNTNGRLLAPTNFFNTNAAAVYRGLTNAGYTFGSGSGADPRLVSSSGIITAASNILAAPNLRVKDSASASSLDILLNGGSIYDIDVNTVTNEAARIRLFRHTSTTNTVDFQILKGNGSSSIAIRLSGSTNDSYINNGGNVGIGTGAPTEKLHVAGNVSASLFLGPASWTNLMNVPAGFADGTDDGSLDFALLTNQPLPILLLSTNDGSSLSNLNAANLYGTATFTNLVVDTLTLINFLAVPASWTNLVNIPAGFADGTDDGAGGGSLDPRIASTSGTMTAGSNTFAAPVFQSSSLTASTVIGTDGGKNIVSYSAGSGISITGGEISATGGGAADGSPGVLTNQFTTNAVGSAIVGDMRLAGTLSLTNGTDGVGITNTSTGNTTNSGHIKSATMSTTGTANFAGVMTAGSDLSVAGNAGITGALTVNQLGSRKIFLNSGSIYTIATGEYLDIGNDGTFGVDLILWGSTSGTPNTAQFRVGGTPRLNILPSGVINITSNLTVNAQIIATNGFLVPTNGMGNAVVDFNKPDVSTNCAAAITFTGISNFKQGVANQAIVHLLATGTHTITFPASWKNTIGAGSTYTTTNGVQTDLLITCQVGLFTNVTKLDYY